jgi:large subunit ribosomal protein L25
MSMSSLDAAARTSGGKGNARRLRAEGRIPAVVYGKDLAAQSISVSPKELRKLLEGEHGLNTLIGLSLPGKGQVPTLVVDYQYHPVSRQLLHADFKQVSLDQPVDTRVPLELTGRPTGVTLGGTLKQVFRDLPIRSLPTQIPVKLLLDVTNLGLEQSAAVKDLQLPEGVKVLLPDAQTIAGVYTLKKLPETEEETAAAAGPAGAKAEAGKEPAKDAKESKAKE